MTNANTKPQPQKQQHQPKPAQARVAEVAYDEPLIGMVLTPFAWVSDQLNAATNLNGVKRKRAKKNPAEKLLSLIAVAGVCWSASNYHIGLQGMAGEPERWSVFPTGRADVEWKPAAVLPPVMEVTSVPVNWVVDGIRHGDNGQLHWHTDPRRWVKPMEVQPRTTIWNNAQGGLYWLGLAGSLGLTMAQALVIRQSPLGEKIKRFNRSNAIRKVSPAKTAIAKAHVDAVSVNSHGVPSLLGIGAIAMAGWAAEFWIGGNALSGSLWSEGAQTGATLFTTFGSELAWAVSETGEDT